MESGSLFSRQGHSITDCVGIETPTCKLNNQNGEVRFSNVGLKSNTHFDHVASCIVNSGSVPSDFRISELNQPEYWEK